MKYEYGKEYETNGKKPDLPDDVMVHAFDFVLMQNYHREVGDINWSHVNKFRVINVRTVEPFKPEVDDSSWHERGELPPVGDECLYFSPLGGSARVEITAHSRRGICFCEVGKTGESYVSKAQAINFRPIRTERERLVNECVKILGGGQLSGDVKTLRDQAELLVSKNWRPIKNQTEDEFNNAVGSKSNREAYRAGCRFIEQGE